MKLRALDAETPRAPSAGEMRWSGARRSRSRWLGFAEVIGVLGVVCALVWGCTRARLDPAAAPAARALSDSPRTAEARTSAADGETPHREVVELGRSVKGVPLRMTVFGDGPERVLIVAGCHGDEPGGAALARELVTHLAEHPAAVSGYTVGVLAEMNPDGLRMGTRLNANGVDLNRNFPSHDWRSATQDEFSHGPVAASEPETRAVMAAVRIIDPCRIVDIHSIMRGWHCNNYDGPGQELARRMSRCNGYAARANIGYPTPGALGNWAGTDLEIPTITLELPRDLDGEQCWRENASAVLAFIAADGAAVTGSDRYAADLGDESSNPVVPGHR